MSTGNNFGSATEWKLAGVIFALGLVFIFTVVDPYTKERVKAAEKQKDEIRAAQLQREEFAKWREEGARALNAADDAIRNEAKERRTRLEKAAVRTTMSNSQGVRIDRYFLSDRRVITCTTTISGNSPAMFNCDGNL